MTSEDLKGMLILIGLITVVPILITLMALVVGDPKDQGPKDGIRFNPRPSSRRSKPKMTKEEEETLITTVAIEDQFFPKQ